MRGTSPNIFFWFYRVFYSQVKGRFFTITRPDAILKFILILVHSTCMSHIPLLALALCHYQTELYIYVNPSRIKKCRTHTELYCLSDSHKKWWDSNSHNRLCRSKLIPKSLPVRKGIPFIILWHMNKVPFLRFFI